MTSTLPSGYGATSQFSGYYRPSVLVAVCDFLGFLPSPGALLMAILATAVTGARHLRHVDG